MDINNEKQIIIKFIKYHSINSIIFYIKLPFSFVYVLKIVISLIIIIHAIHIDIIINRRNKYCSEITIKTLINKKQK